MATAWGAGAPAVAPLCPLLSSSALLLLHTCFLLQAAAVAIANIYYGCLHMADFGAWTWGLYTAVLSLIVGASLAKDAHDWHRCAGPLCGWQRWAGVQTHGQNWSVAALTVTAHSHPRPPPPPPPPPSLPPANTAAPAAPRGSRSTTCPCRRAPPCCSAFRTALTSTKARPRWETWRLRRAAGHGASSWSLLPCSRASPPACCQAAPAALIPELACLPCPILPALLLSCPHCLCACLHDLWMPAARFNVQ